MPLPDPEPANIPPWHANPGCLVQLFAASIVALAAQILKELFG